MSVRRIAVPFLLVSLAACDEPAQRDIERAELRAKDAEARASAAEKDREVNATRLGDAERRLRDLESEAEKLRPAVAAAEAAAKSAEEAAARVKKVEKEKEAVAAHRDELKEWVEKTLLPIAEEHDPRLVNLKTAAAEMAAEVARLRGLPWKHDVMRRLVSRAEVGDWMRRDMKKDMPEDKAREMVLVGAEMGLCKTGTDVYQIFSQFMEAGAAAFYKPDTRTFYHIEGNDGRGAYPVVFHELVHALEDQYFDLDALYKDIENDSDRELAMRGLVEGSASLFQGLYEKEHPDDQKAMVAAQMKPELIGKQIKMMSEVPPFLIAAMGLYPYQNGKAWCRKMGAEDPTVAERLYREPPVSTEQVLHPEKFSFDGPRDWPHAVAKPQIGDVLGAGWKELESDTMGELVTGVLLAQLRQGGAYGPTFLSVGGAIGGFGLQGPTKKAVEGWDGDRYAAWVRDGSDEVVIVWSTVWDSDADAKEFAETYAPLLGRKVTGAKVAEVPSPVRFADAGSGRTSGIEARGRRVVAVLGAPAANFDALLDRGFAAPVTPDARDLADKT